MTTPSTRTICAACQKEKITYFCQGCSEIFCFEDLSQHRTNVGQQLDHIANNHDELRLGLNEQKTDPTKRPFIKQINQWKKDSIDKIQQTAEQCRERFIHYSNVVLLGIERRLNNLAERIKEMRRENEFNEIDLKHLIEGLQKMQEEFLQPSNLSIERQSTLFIDNISDLISWGEKKNALVDLIGWIFLYKRLTFCF